MTGDKIKEVIRTYEAKLDGKLYSPRLIHVRGMLPKVKAFVAEGRIEKAFRWLGFIQGVLWCESVYSIEAMKDHNRPNDEQEA